MFPDWLERLFWLFSSIIFQWYPSLKINPFFRATCRHLTLFFYPLYVTLSNLKFLPLEIILMARISWSSLIKNCKQDFSYPISTCFILVTVMNFIHSFIANNLFDDPIKSFFVYSFSKTYLSVSTYVTNIGNK